MENMSNTGETGGESRVEEEIVKERNVKIFDEEGKRGGEEEESKKKE